MPVRLVWRSVKLQFDVLCRSLAGAAERLEARRLGRARWPVGELSVLYILVRLAKEDLSG